MRMIGKAAGDIAHHVLNKGRPRKGVFSHELLILALEQRIDGRRAGRLGDLDEILDPAEPAHPDRHAHVGPLAVRAFAADGLRARAYGHHGNRHFEQERRLAVLGQLAGQPALIGQNAGAGRRGGVLLHKIRKMKDNMRPAGVQALPHVLKQALHPRVVQILSPVRQSLHKTAHVRALERSGQIHADVHIGDRMLRPLRAIPHQQRQLQPFDPYPVDGQRHRSRTVLYVFHSFPLSYSQITKNVIPASCRGSFV